MKHLNICFLTTSVQKKYLQVLFGKSSAYKSKYTLKPLRCILLKRLSQCPWISFTSSTELKSSFPFPLTFRVKRDWICQGLFVLSTSATKPKQTLSPLAAVPGDRTIAPKRAELLLFCIRRRSKDPCSIGLGGLPSYHHISMQTWQNCHTTISLWSPTNSGANISALFTRFQNLQKCLHIF